MAVSVTTTAPSVHLAKTLVAFTLTAIMSSGQLYLVIPLLHDMAGEWGTSAAGLSWMVTAFGVGYAAGFLIFGPLSDRYGRRRLVSIGLPLAALATALVALSPSMEVALGLRVLQGVAVAIFPPAALSYVAERLDSRRRMVAITTITSGFLAAAVLAQVAAQSLVGTLGWRGLFLASAVLFAATFVANRAIMRQDPPVLAGGSLATVYRAYPALLRRPELALRYVGTVVILGSFVAVYAGLQLGGADNLLALRASGLPSMIVIPLVMPWLARIPATRRALLAFTLGAASLALVGLTSPGSLGLGLLLAVYVATIALVAPSINEAIAGLAGQARGAAVALFTFSLFLGASLGPQVAAAFPDFSTLMYGLAGALLLGAIAIHTATRFERPAP
ncbi:MFS transporter [Nonomuraea sp. NPDC050556]|uniref:MFS transporter n=1 Tax=Nonomuraea sp. NPDC050556 TaxID=3364369 RepID=UPI0037AB3E12